jgi:DNA topoisomerase-6 subunit B
MKSKPGQAAETSAESTNGATSESNGAAHAENGASPASAPPAGARRRATAESMAAKQRDISVSEFFAKNRHLLGFDNPRKALITTVKEAVDNSLDACEEAGILPEIWVHIRPTGPNRFQVGIQDNGPGILKKQIPLIFGKLLYGSKFHRLRQSRGQQGIGISAAGMYGVQTTGKPVKILSKVSKGKPAHYYEIQIDTKRNQPKILNGKGEGVDIPPGEKGRKYIELHGIEWVDQPHGTRVTIELEARYQRGRGSVDEYLEQTAIANPHIALHYTDPEENYRLYARSTDILPKEPSEIKPHPYGVELGRLAALIADGQSSTLSQFLTGNFSRVSPGVARRIARGAKLSPRASIKRLSRPQVDALYHSIQETKIAAPATDCISPIGEDLILKGLHQVVPGEFYAAVTRPPAVYRGNPFQVEVGLVYGGASSTQNVTRELLQELIDESDARTIRQFLVNTFVGLGGDGADRIIKESSVGTRQGPGKLKPKEVDRLHEAMKNVNLSDDLSMNVLRYANRVPLQFQTAACAITQTVVGANWRSYGLSQSRGALPRGPVTIMVHLASVWVPFTSESKEAIAGYPEIQKELRLGLQAVGRKLAMFLRRRLRVRQESDRRTVFLRYLGEVATAVSQINKTNRDPLYEQLLMVAKKKTAQADVELDERGRPMDDGDDPGAIGGAVLIVDAESAIEQQINRSVAPRDGEVASSDEAPTEVPVSTSHDSQSERRKKSGPRKKVRKHR